MSRPANWAWVATSVRMSSIAGLSYKAAVFAGITMTLNKFMVVFFAVGSLTDTWMIRNTLASTGANIVSIHICIIAFLKILMSGSVIASLTEAADF